MEVDRAALRAQEEYDKAGRAFQQGDRQDAALYLGAMTHYVGDVSAYASITVMRPILAGGISK